MRTNSLRPAKRKTMRRILLDPDPPQPTSGGQPPQPPPETPPSPPSDPGPAPEDPPQPGPTPAPPRAGRIVVTGEKTERELSLERNLRDRETRLAELEDENRRLKTPPQPRPAPQKRSWLEGGTFFEG